MRLAVVGSRGVTKIDLSAYIPDGVTELVSGGADGVDSLVAVYADEHGIPLTVFLPQYERFGRAAPLRRNDEIIGYADEVLAIWDGRSNGTRYVIDRCRRSRVPCRVIVADEEKKP